MYRIFLLLLITTPTVAYAGDDPKAIVYEALADWTFARDEVAKKYAYMVSQEINAIYDDRPGVIIRNRHVFSAGKPNFKSVIVVDYAPDGKQRVEQSLTSNGKRKVSYGDATYSREYKIQPPGISKKDWILSGEGRDTLNSEPFEAPIQGSYLKTQFQIKDATESFFLLERGGLFRDAKEVAQGNIVAMYDRDPGSIEVVFSKAHGYMPIKITFESPNSRTETRTKWTKQGDIWLPTHIEALDAQTLSKSKTQTWSTIKYVLGDKVPKESLDFETKDARVAFGKLFQFEFDRPIGIAPVEGYPRPVLPGTPWIEPDNLFSSAKSK